MQAVTGIAGDEFHLTWKQVAYGGPGNGYSVHLIKRGLSSHSPDDEQRQTKGVKLQILVLAHETHKYVLMLFLPLTFEVVRTSCSNASGRRQIKPLL